MVALPGAVAPSTSAVLPWRKPGTPPVDLAPRTDVIAEFLRTTVADAIHLVSIVPDGVIGARWFGDNARAAAIWAGERNAAGANVYWTVNRAREGLNAKPGKVDIVAARFQHVDIDPPKDGTPWQRDQAISALAELDSPPSFVIDSGGGLQAFWRLEEEVLNFATTEAVNRGIQARFGADACWNVDRLMRVPGTVNYPDERKRKRGRLPTLSSVVEPDDGTVHELFVLAHRFPEPVQTAEEAPRAAVATMVSALLTADDLGLGPFDPLRMLIEAPRGEDRSADALRCAGELVRAGRTDAEIMGVLLNPANPVSVHCLKHRDPAYAAARCLSRARGDQSKVEADTAAGAAIASDMGIVAQSVVTGDIRATPYLGRSPSALPLRPWVYGRYLLRNTVAAVVAPGGVGKSSLMVGTALALATGQAILCTPVWDGPKTAWLWNLEDDGDELARQIEAACARFGLSPADYGDRLFVDSGLDGQGLCTAVEGKDGVRILRPIYDALAAEIQARGVDVLIIDPFVSSHQVDENANTKIDAIAKEWARLAKRCNCAIVLVHHAGKMQGKKITSEASRGASALVAAARSTLVLNRLDDEDGERLGIPVRERRRYFSVGDDKHNRAPAESVDWYRLDSVSLGNGGIEGGDSVGVVVPWTPPKASDQITAHDLRRVQTAIASGSWRFDTRARESWAGVAIADTLGLSVDQDKARILDLLKQWIASGALKVIQAKDHAYKERSFVEVDVWIADIHPPVA